MNKQNKNNIKNNNNSGEIIIYEGADGAPNIEVRIDGETVWLSQSQLVELFQSSKANVSEHIKNIFTEKELQKEATVRNFRTVQNEGSRDVSRDNEYKKYQAKTLSPVEKAYLENIKLLEKKVEKKIKDKN